MDSSFGTGGGGGAGHYYAYGAGSGQHPQAPQMGHHHFHRGQTESPMMVSSPTPPYLPPGYGGAAANVRDPSASSGGMGFNPYQEQQAGGGQQHGWIPIQQAEHRGFQQHQAALYFNPQPFPPPPPPHAPSGSPPVGGLVEASQMGFAGAAGMATAGGGEHSRDTSTGDSGEIDQVVQQDIERGLRIDFYSESNNMLLASWASFFRDQFVEARNQLAKANYDRTAESYRRATHFVERVEYKILNTGAMKQLFRRHPLTSINDPVSAAGWLLLIP